MNEDQSPNTWYGVAVGIFPTSVLMMAVFLPAVNANDTEQWRVDTIWELAVGLPLSIAIGAFFGFICLAVGFAVGGLIEVTANRKRSFENRLDSEDIAAIVAIATGTGLAIAAYASVIKSFTIFY